MFPSKWTLALLGNSMLRTAVVPYWGNRKLFSLACVPSMCSVVILSTHVWIGVQHWLIHWNCHSFCNLASGSVWTSLHCNLRVSISCGLWTLEIQHYCTNKTKFLSWNCLVVLHFCWYKNMYRITVTSFWEYQYCLNYHSISQKGYYFTYWRNTHASLLTEKNSWITK